MVHYIIYDQKSVVHIVTSVNLYWWVLGIVTLDVQLQLLGNMPRIDCRVYALLSFVQKDQYRLVYIVVYQDDVFMCGSDQV